MKAAIFTLTFLLAGAACFYHAGKEAYQNYTLLRDGTRYEGRVTGSAFRSVRDDEPVPVIKFVDRTGKEHKFESRAVTSFSDYKTGQKVQVLYDENTERIRIDTYLGLYFSTFVLCIMGLVAWSPFIIMLALYLAQRLGLIDASQIANEIYQSEN